MSWFGEAKKEPSPPKQRIADENVRRPDRPKGGRASNIEDEQLQLALQTSMQDSVSFFPRKFFVGKNSN